MYSNFRIKVFSYDLCGSPVSCADYFDKNRIFDYNKMQQIKTLTLDLYKTGHNNFFVEPFLVEKTFIMMWRSKGGKLESFEANVSSNYMIGLDGQLGTINNTIFNINFVISPVVRKLTAYHRKLYINPGTYKLRAKIVELNLTTETTITVHPCKLNHI